MKPIIVAIALTVLSAQAVFAQTPGTAASGSSNSMMSGAGGGATPTVPPSLTPDQRVTGSAPSGTSTETMRRYNEARQNSGTVGAAPAASDKAVRDEDRLIDTRIKNICKNC